MNRKKAILEQIPAIAADAKKANLLLVKPTAEDLHRANSIVLKFIRDRDRIMYGGTAIHEFLKLVGGGIYPEGKVFDYDFYSPDFLNDSAELADLLYQAGFRNIRVVNGMISTTRKVFVDFDRDSIADISYLTPKLWKSVPTKIINGIRYTFPEYIKIDIYKMLSYSLFEDNYRFEKAYDRLNILEEAYPMKSALKSMEPLLIKEHQPLIKSTLETLEKHKKDFMFLGSNIWESMMKQKLQFNHLPIEIMAFFPSKIVESFKSNPKVNINRYSRIGERLMEQIEIFVGNTSVLQVYYMSLAATCTKWDGYLVASYYLETYFMYMQLFKSRFIKNEMYDTISYMIKSLYEENKKGKNKYMSIFDSDIFFHKNAEKVKEEPLRIGPYFPDPERNKEQVNYNEQMKKIPGIDFRPILE